MLLISNPHSEQVGRTVSLAQAGLLCPSLVASAWLGLPPWVGTSPSCVPSSLSSGQLAAPRELLEAAALNRSSRRLRVRRWGLGLALHLTSLTGLRVSFRSLLCEPQPMGSDALCQECLRRSPQPVCLGGSLHRHFPHRAQHGGWTSPCGSYYDHRMPFSK